MKTNSMAAVLGGALLQIALIVLHQSAAAQVTGEGAATAETKIRRITLDEALGLLGSNFELQLARSAAAEAEALARQSSAYPNPAFNISHETLDESGLDISESYFTLSQRMEWPATRSARQAVANEDAAAARIRVVADSTTLAFRVKRTYTEAARTERDVQTLERVTAVFRRAEASAAERYEAGDVALYELRRIEVERVRYEAALADALLGLVASRRQLALLIAPASGNLQLAPAAPPVGMPPMVDLDRVGELAVNQRAGVAAREAGVRSAQAELRGIRAQRVPDLTANGGFKRQSDGFSGLFLGMSVPLPFWNRSRGGIEAAEARVTGGQTHLSLARMEVEADARRALAVYHSQMQRAELLSDVGQGPSVDLLEIAQFAYDAGEMDLIDLLDAAEALHDAEVAVVRIQSEVWISYYDLERAVGGFGDLGGQGEDDE